jgi:hypothetical protein
VDKKKTRIAGEFIRSELRRRNLPGGTERVCCGGRIRFSKDYKSQLKALNMHGSFEVTEKGAITAFIDV